MLANVLLRVEGEKVYHTVFEPAHPSSERVMAAGAARALRDVLVGAVEKGTAMRIKAETARPGTLPHCFKASTLFQ